MLILFGHDRHSVSIETDAAGCRRCEFVDHIDAYAARQIGPELCEAFERHLIHCGPCRRAVNLGRISSRLNHHNRSVGMHCAAQTRRTS